jgi:hypothetical protein
MGKFTRPRSTRNVKIAHVYDTKDNENVWIVKMSNGIKKELAHSTIIKKKLITEETTWTYRRIGCKCRYSVGKEFRFVHWQGFAEPTREPVDFKPQVEDTDEDTDSKKL